jgi:hypothetical protein
MRVESSGRCLRGALRGRRRITSAIGKRWPYVARRFIDRHYGQAGMVRLHRLRVSLKGKDASPWVSSAPAIHRPRVPLVACPPVLAAVGRGRIVPRSDAASAIRNASSRESLGRRAVAAADPGFRSMRAVARLTLHPGLFSGAPSELLPCIGRATPSPPAAFNHRSHSPNLFRDGSSSLNFRRSTHSGGAAG